MSVHDGSIEKIKEKIGSRGKEGSQRGEKPEPIQKCEETETDKLWRKLRDRTRSRNQPDSQQEDNQEETPF